jgi:homoserine dehydrogenase
MEVHFAIPIVWIAHESVAKMEQVTKVSKALKDAVNEPNEVTDGPDADKVVDMTRVIESRKLMATVIKTLANGEDEVTSNKEFAQIGRGSKKGGEVNLMGYLNYVGF